MHSKAQDVLIMLVNHMDYGGCQKIVYEILCGVFSDFSKVYLIANHGYYGEKLIDETNIDFVDRTSLSLTDTFKKIREIQRGKQRVILHTHNRKDLIFKYAISRKNKHLHTFHSAYTDKNFLYFFLKPKHAISISRTVSSYLDKYNIPNRIIYNGIDDIEKTTLKPQNSQTILKYIGRTTREKGFDDLLQSFVSFKQLFAEFRNLKMDVIGNGENLNSYKEYLRKTDFINDVRFLGFLENPWKEVSQEDLVVIPSYFEGFCLVAAEAGSLGIPVIGNDIKALREVLDFIPEENFFDVRDKTSIYAGLKFFFKNKKSQQKLAYSHKSEVKSRFSKEKMILQYQNVYENL